MDCSHLFFLSTIACKLSECLSEKELAELSADLVVLSDMLANILAYSDTNGGSNGCNCRSDGNSSDSNCTNHKSDGNNSDSEQNN